MTKKSQARLARDAHEAAQNKLKEGVKEQNTCWDDVENIYKNCMMMLLQHGALADVSQVGPLIVRVADKKTLVTNLRLLAGDLKTLSTELARIHDLHAQFKGGTNDVDEYYHSIKVFQHYGTWMQRYEAICTPTALHIAEQLTQAEGLYVAEQSATDPNVVTDVEVKTVQPTDTPTIH